MNEKRLKRVLSDKAISQKELADAVGVSQAFISYVIKGYKVPSVAVLKRMSDYLGISVEELI